MVRTLLPAVLTLAELMLAELMLAVLMLAVLMLVREFAARVAVKPPGSGTAAISIVVAIMSDDAAAAGRASSICQTSASASAGSVASAS